MQRKSQESAGLLPWALSATGGVCLRIRTRHSHVKWESESRSVVSGSLPPHGLYNPWNSPGYNTRIGSHSLLQGIFPTQALNPGLPQCRRILNQLSHQGSSRVCSTGVDSRSLLWGNLPNPGIEPRSPALQVDSLPSEPPGKPQREGRQILNHWTTREVQEHA